MTSLTGKLFKYLFIYSLAFFYASCIFWMVIYKFIRHGKQIFRVKTRTVPPPCLLDPDLGTHAFIKLKEVKIHYVEAGDRNKPLMLFVHGFPEFWYSWRHQMREFRTTHWVVAIDMRGYGDSDKPSGVSSYQTRKIVDDLKEIIVGLGKSSAVVVGHDWGGAIVWRFAMQYPELVEKLIVMNCPHPTAFSQHLRSSFKQFLMSWYMFAIQVPFLPEKFLRFQDLQIFNKWFIDQICDPHLFTEEDIEAYKYTFGKPGAFTAPLNYYRNIFFSKGPTILTSQPKPKKNDIIQVPVLIIWGDADFALHSKMAKMSTQYVENCTLKMIPNCSHWVQQHSPQLVNEYMSDFLYDYSKPRRLVRRIGSMRRQLVSSVSGVMRWTGMMSQTKVPVSNDSRLVTKLGKRMIVSTFHIVHRMSGAPLTGLQSIALVI